MAAQIDRLSVDLEIVTPLFLGGANPQGPPELRPPSVRGALRFWWRAWHQACAPSATAEELYRAESEVFGATDGASPFTLRLAGRPRWFREKRQVASGINYLLYGLHTHRKGESDVQYRPAFVAGRNAPITLTVAVRAPAAPWQGKLDVLRALWLLCNLGGLGARTRRGAGALAPSRTPDCWPSSLPPLKLEAGSPSELRDNLAQALRLLITGAPPAEPPMREVPALHPKTARILVFNNRKPWPSWEAALEQVGANMRSFRQRYCLNDPDSDYHAVKAFIGNTAHPAPRQTVERAAFGLPLNFYYRSLPGSQEEKKASITGTAGDEQGIDRSASPLHFRVVKLARGGYAVVVLVFDTPLLPDGCNLDLVTGETHAQCKPPGRNIINKYLAHADAGVAPLLEVDYA